MNLHIISGRLTADPEIRKSQNDTSIANFSLAVDRRFRRENDPEVDFFNCVAFAKKAEFCAKYLKKGTKIIVKGAMENNNYQTPEKNVYSFNLIVEEVEFASSKKTEKDNDESGDGFINIPDGIDETLPFN